MLTKQVLGGLVDKYKCISSAVLPLALWLIKRSHYIAIIGSVFPLGLVVILTH